MNIDDYGVGRVWLAECSRACRGFNAKLAVEGWACCCLAGFGLVRYVDLLLSFESCNTGIHTHDLILVHQRVAAVQTAVLRLRRAKLPDKAAAAVQPAAAALDTRTTDGSANTSARNSSTQCCWMNGLYRSESVEADAKPMIHS
jgi:hypothetical protein